VTVDVPQTHLVGQLNAQLAINFAMFEAVKSLRLQYQGQVITYDKARSQLERDVRKSYNQMLLLGKQIELLGEDYAMAKRQADQAEANYRAGRSPELAMLQARVAMENKKPTMDSAENGLILAMASFAMNLGLPYDTEFELEPIPDEAIFIPLDLRELINKAANGKPDILELQNSILTLQSGRKAKAYQNFTPNLVLGWNTQRLVVDSAKGIDEEGNYQDSGSLSVSLSYSLNGLLPFGSDGNARKDMDDNLRLLNIALAQTVRGTEIEVYNTVLTLRQAQASYEALTLTAGLAERSYKMTEDAYRAGLQDLVEVQNSGLQLQQARFALIQQHFNYLSGLVDLEYTTGVPFGTLTGVNK
jgi:outer membrane protein TolC